MAKRPSLADSPIGQRAHPKASAKAAEPDAIEAAAAGARRAWPPPDQRDFKGLMCRVNRDGWRALSMLSVEIDRPLQAMMVEALNDYLEKHGKAPVVESRAVPKD